MPYTLKLSKEEAADLWLAIYMQYGNETPLWITMREALGDDFNKIAYAAGKVDGKKRAKDILADL